MSAQTASSKFYKIVIIGDDGVGKSTFLQTYIKQNMENYFPVITEPTDESDQFKFQMIFDNRTLLFCEYDKSLDVGKDYYCDANAAIVLINATKPDAIENVGYWITNVIKKREKMLPTIVVGNHFGNADAVRTEDVLEYLYNLGNTCACMIPYIEISSFDENLHFILENLITMMECNNLENCSSKASFLRGGCGIKQHYLLLETKS